MDFKKIFHQAVREIKREVNLKVLNVPEIEQQVLDATSDEPWGPHGSDLSDIAAATKASFLECDLVMSVLWQRLSNTKANWRHLYKALVVIEYLVANGSERAVDDVYDNISQITALSSFEFVEPNGKDVGLSVRKKSDAILSLFDDREKLQEVREKAAATRDKYIGLSSTGLSHKPSSASFGSGYYDSTKYGYGGTNRPKESDLFISNRGTKSYSGGERNHQQPKEKVRQRSPKSTLKDVSDDDFDPRAVATNSASAVKSAESIDISVPNLMDDIFDTPTSTPNSNATTEDVQGEVDLFADSAFQSATLNSKETSVQANIDLFANITSEAKPNSSISNTKTDNSFDPFSAIPLHNIAASNTRPDQTVDTEFEFGTFTSSGTEKSHEKLKIKDGAPQVKSGIWVDSLSLGLIDLDIAAPKKISLADKKDSALRQPICKTKVKTINQ